MKALLLTDYLNLEFTDMPVPDIGPTDVLVRVRACGICGSDVHGWDGSSGPPQAAAGDGSRGRRHNRARGRRGDRPRRGRPRDL